ncbi:MAG TPA: LamG domain-containing protein [Polyangiaceae bacterium]|nr:LamG domain-containing protein [Polyangiaceae bacterium]
MRLDSAALANVSIGNVPALDFERTDPFSIAAWFRTKDSSMQIIAGKSKTSLTDTGYFMALGQYNPSFGAAGKLGFVLSDAYTDTSHWIGADTSAGPALNDNFWHHAVLTYDGSVSASGFQFFVDAVAVTTTATGYSITGTTKNTAAFMIGGRISLAGPAQLTFNGDLADVAVYSKALSAAEVSAIHSVVNAPDLTDFGAIGNLRAFWRPSFRAGRTTIADLSSSGNDGTPTRGVSFIRRTPVK